MQSNEPTLEELREVARAFMLVRDGWRADLYTLMSEVDMPRERFDAAVEKLFSVDGDEVSVRIDTVEEVARLSGDGYAIAYEAGSFNDSSLKYLTLIVQSGLAPYSLKFFHGLSVMREALKSDDPFKGEVVGLVYCHTCKRFASPEVPEVCSHIKILVETALTFAIHHTLYKYIFLPVELRAFALRMAPLILRHHTVEVDGAKVEMYDTRYGVAVVCLTCGSHMCTHASAMRR
ncbi:MAG: hypothetical protein QXH00_09160 [Candidatus Jordarchaeales archaeon]